MHVDHHRARAIPFWCNFILTCCVLALIPACSDRSQKAAQSAALAQKALENSNLAEARSAIAAAIAERDDILGYHMLRGRIELASGSPGGAYDAYSDALALDPTNGEALLAVAELGLATGNFRESLESAERVLTLAPNQLDALLIRGIHSIVQRDYTDAVGYGDKILAIAPGHEGGTILKSRALFMAREPDKALEALSQISGDAATSQPAALTRLEIYRAMRRPADMMTEFERLRGLRPDDLPLRIDEANFRYKVGHRRQARELVAEALSSPDASATDAESALALWQEYGSEDVPAQTIGQINLEGSVAARQALARFLIQHGRVDDAAAVIARLPPDAGAGLRARHLLMTGNSREASRRAAAVIERDATDCDALVAASESALKNRKPDDALRYAQIASSECPNLSGGWMSAVRAYQELGRDSGMRRMFVEALDANKQSSELTEAYTRWLVAEGRPREAVAMARRLTRYAPALISGWRIYAELCRMIDQRCIAEAQRGLANALTMFGIDLPPGTPPPNGLFGRLIER